MCIAIAKLRQRGISPMVESHTRYYQIGRSKKQRAILPADNFMSLPMCYLSRYSSCDNDTRTIHQVTVVFQPTHNKKKNVSCNIDYTIIKQSEDIYIYIFR